MEIGVFLLGALGALLTVYLAKQEVIPEFRPLFDTSEKEKETREHQDHIKRTEKHIDDITDKLEQPLDKDVVTQLKTVLKTSQEELREERARLQTLEREIKQSQIISRSLGFFFYIVLGGVFGSLLAGKVKVEGLSGDLPTYFQSIVIGATWITYLSTIGFRSGQKKADDIIEAGKKETAETIEAFKKELAPRMEKIVANAEKAEKVDDPVHAPDVKRMLDEEIGKMNMTAQKNWDMTRQMVQRNVKGLL
jgi:DNA repair exonuclease SbcCD ATPase subunit